MDFFNWDFVMPSRSTPAFQFGQLKFDLRYFVDISYLTHFAITSLVTFTELCILLCYEVFVLKFRKRVFNLRLIFVRHFVCPGSVLSELSIIFNFTILHSISLFCTQFHFFALVKLHCSLIWD